MEEVEEDPSPNKHTGEENLLKDSTSNKRMAPTTGALSFERTKEQTRRDQDMWSQPNLGPSKKTGTY